MFCVSKTRGVSSPFICYRFGKISKYIFTTGYANVIAYKKRACSPKNMANPAKDLLCHSGVPPAFLFRRAKRKFCRKPARHHPPLTLTHQRYIAPGRTRLQGFGGRSQSPEKKLSPYIENRASSKEINTLKNL